MGTTEPTLVVIIGAGGHGREVLDVVDAMNAAGGSLKMLGFIEIGPVAEELLLRRGTGLLDPDKSVVALGAQYVIGIGSGDARQRIDGEMQQSGGRAATLVHPAASLGADNHLGDGCVLAAGSRVTNNVRIGRHVHLNLNSTIGHDCVIGDYVSVFPCATVSGNVRIGTGVTVGTGANILPGISIGDWASIGAGAVVTKNVEAGVTVVGSPARPLSPNQ